MIAFFDRKIGTDDEVHSMLIENKVAVPDTLPNGIQTVAIGRTAQNNHDTAYPLCCMKE